MAKQSLRKLMYIFASMVIAVTVGIIGYTQYQYVTVSNQVDVLVRSDKITVLEKQVSLLSAQIETLTDAYADLADRPREVVRREIIREKSQDELLTEAVAMVAPTVVSVVVTKDVPLLEVVYENPFGDDPFFRDFGVRVPRYRQQGTEEQQTGAGTGFILTSNGYIATNRHVVDDIDARYTVLLADGSQQPAEVVYRDDVIDFAMLKIAGSSYPTVRLGNSSDLKLGQSVFAIGNALGEYSNSVSTGIVSGLDRDITAQGGSSVAHLEGIIQTDAAINPGNSGGPLSDFGGRVIGINVATAQGSNNISFAIPINFVKEILEKVILE